MLIHKLTLASNNLNKQKLRKINKDSNPNPKVQDGHSQLSEYSEKTIDFKEIISMIIYEKKNKTNY